MFSQKFFKWKSNFKTRFLSLPRLKRGLIFKFNYILVNSRAKYSKLI